MLRVAIGLIGGVCWASGVSDGEVSDVVMEGKEDAWEENYSPVSDMDDGKLFDVYW